MLQSLKVLTIAAGVLGFGALSAVPVPAAAQSAGVNPAWVVGAYPAPPKGKGTGRLEAWQVGTSLTRTASFAKPHTVAGNSFYVAFDPATSTLYVPTVAGRVYLLNAKTLKVTGQFRTVKDARVARVSPDGKTLLVVSGKRTAAYALPGHKHAFTVRQGGNAIAFNNDATRAFVGGNMRPDIIEIDLANGHVMNHIAIGHSGDLAWADGKLFSANMKSGVMSVLDPATGTVRQIKTDEVDPGFSYKHIPTAAAGFMQIAVDPAAHRLYVAGFSGHILKFATDAPRYLGEVAVNANPKGNINHLSGLTLVDGGHKALTTVENLKSAVVVRLSDGTITRHLTSFASNRWVALGSR